MQAVIARFLVYNNIRLCMRCDIYFASGIKIRLWMLISSFSLPSFTVQFYNIFNIAFVSFINFCSAATKPSLF